MTMGVPAALKAAVVLTFCAFTFNEANANAVDVSAFAYDLHSLRPHFDPSEEDHTRSMNAIMQSMTSHSALDMLRHNKDASPELVSLAQTVVSHTRLRAKASVSSKVVSQSLRSSKGFDMAASSLNKLLFESFKKYDLEILKCRDYYGKQCSMIESTRGEIAASNFKVAQCRSHILAAESSISAGEGSVGPAKQALKEHRDKCKRDIADLRYKLVADGKDVEANQKMEPSLTDPAEEERFISMQSGLSDGHSNMEDEILQLEHSCEETAVSMSRAVQKAEQNLKQAQTKLAEGTGCENEAAEVGRLTNVEFMDLTKELKNMKGQCSTNYQAFETEICGLKKLRIELYIKMKGMGGKPFIQDCKVSEWTAGECSKECGGGQQQMNRMVDTQPVEGAKCLPLSEVRRCNDHPCPVDCKVSQWSGWSSCSAECGGGIQERLRTVVRNMKHAGNPCGDVSETQACAVQSCEADCELTGWGKWGKCSKQCDAGTRKRFRHVRTQATGQGDCPAPGSSKRTQFKKCHIKSCPKPAKKSTIQCGSKLDLILVLDGSGSLGKKGWAATRKAAGLILDSMDKEKVQVAVLAYSGPTKWAQVKKCWTDPKINQEFTCKQKWLQHMSPKNLDKAKTKVKFAPWSKGSTMTSLALMNALAETQLGRQDAQTVVVVITDGEPLSKRATWRSAKALRKVARLMWVPVTKDAPVKMIRRMATRRWKENVIEAKSFKTLQKPKFIDHIIADMCPTIVK